MYGEENIIRSDPRRQRPICIVILVPLTKRGIYRRKADRRQKEENAQDAREISEAMQERAPRAKFARLEPEKA